MKRMIGIMVNRSIYKDNETDRLILSDCRQQDQLVGIDMRMKKRMRE